MTLEVDKGLAFDPQEDAETAQVPKKRLARMLRMTVVAERHRAFLKRKKGGTKWRARKLYRVAAKRFCQNLDNQYRCSANKLGLVHFQPDKKLKVWSSWKTWPHFGLAMDLGGEQNTGQHALLRKFKLNGTLWNDPNHGCNCDLDLAVNWTELRGLIILWAIHFNLPHGPAPCTDQRRHEIRGVMSKCYEDNETPTLVPLFLEYSLDIIKYLKRREEPRGGSVGFHAGATAWRRRR